jgi:adenine phosphoribosyltransferase
MVSPVRYCVAGGYNGPMEYFDLDFFEIHRRLPLTHISRNKEVATFTIIGDVELTERAGEEMEKKLKLQGIEPDCFVGPGMNITNFVHHMAVRFDHRKYVILRKSIRNYMIQPEVQLPWRQAPKHARKLVINGPDAAYLKGKKVVLVDDVVSTGTTMQMLQVLMKRLGAEVIATVSIFVQGERCFPGLIYLAKLPIYVVTSTGEKELLTEER